MARLSSARKYIKSQTNDGGVYGCGGSYSEGGIMLNVHQMIAVVMIMMMLIMVLSLVLVLIIMEINDDNNSGDSIGNGGSECNYNDGVTVD